MISESVQEGYKKLNDLKTMGISAPQSIAQISDEKYLQIKTRGGIDERFTVD